MEYAMDDGGSRHSQASRPGPDMAEPVLIDCDADPYVPKGWTVASHRHAGRLDWRAALADPAFAAGEDRATRDLNANVLDHLLAHRGLIPAAWKNGPRGGIRYVFFGGTLYRNIGGRLCVRYLCWIGQWQWMTLWLGPDSCCFIPAALRTG